MPTQTPQTGEHTPDSRTVYRSGESQTWPASPGRIVGDETASRVSWANFVTNLPEAAHVASVAPPAARFGAQRDFHREAATQFALEGIGRGEKVLLIGSRWQHKEVLRGIEDFRRSFDPPGNPPSWRNRDLDLFDAFDVQSELLVDDMPDGMHFASFIKRACEPIRGPGGIRVWNNLGARLLESGNRRASSAIERLWHQARSPLRVTILCSYPLPDESSMATLENLSGPLGRHTHLIRPCRGGVAVERLERRAATVQWPGNFGDGQKPWWSNGP